jgi:hypothetical protein
MPLHFPLHEPTSQCVNFTSYFLLIRPCLLKRKGVESGRWFYYHNGTGAALLVFGSCLHRCSYWLCNQVIRGRSQQSKTVLPDYLRRTAFSVRNNQTPFLLNLLAVIDFVVTHRTVANLKSELWFLLPSSNPDRHQHFLKLHIEKNISRFIASVNL